MIIRFVAKLIAVLNSNTKPFQVGAGIACGLLLALVPARSLFFAVIVLVVFLVRVHLGMTIVSMLGFSVIVPVFDRWLNSLGAWLLGLQGPQGVYQTLYAVPVIPWTRFNNTLVAGSLVAGFLLWVPAAFGAVALVNLYRAKIHPRIVNSKLVKAVMATPLARKVVKAVQGVRAIWPAAG